MRKLNLKVKKQKCEQFHNLRIHLAKKGPKRENGVETMFFMLSVAIVRPLSHLRFYRAILSHDIIARQKSPYATARVATATNR